MTPPTEHLPTGHLPTSPQMAALTSSAARATPITDVTTHRRAAARAAAAQVLPPGISARPAPGRPGSERIAADDRQAPGMVLYLHSGGYAAGSPALCRELAARIVTATPVAFDVPAYRLAPEHPYPAALDDACAAYRRLLTTHSPERIAVAGASAGGGLALATLLRLRAERLPQPAAAFVLSPWADLTLTSASVHDPHSRDPLNSPSYLQELAGHYLAGEPATAPYPSPALADLAGLPPLHVEVGGTERLLDDALLLTTRYARAGGSVTLAVTAGALHTFPHSAVDTPESTAAFARISQHLHAHLEVS